MGSSVECTSDHNACTATWCDCGCHHALIDAHYSGEHPAPVEKCQACAKGYPSGGAEGVPETPQTLATWFRTVDEALRELYRTVVQSERPAVSLAHASTDPGR